MREEGRDEEEALSRGKEGEGGYKCASLSISCPTSRRGALSNSNFLVNAEDGSSAGLPL